MRSLFFYIEAEHLKLRKEKVATFINLFDSHHISCHANKLLQGLTCPPKEISTGITALDDITYGLHVGELTVIASRPSTGQLALTLHIVNHVAGNNIPTLIFSNKHTPDTMLRCFIANNDELDIRTLYASKLTDSVLHKSSVAIAELSQKPIFIFYQNLLNQTMIESVSDDFASHYNDTVKLLIIDDLQGVLSDDTCMDTGADINSITRYLKQLALDKSYCVIALSQLDKQLELRNNKRPLHTDVIGSEVPQITDNLWLLYRDEIYNQHSHMKNIVDVNIVKQNQRRIGAVPIKYEPEHARFKSPLD